MAKKTEPAFPLERQVGYIGSWAAVGGVFGAVSCMVARYVRPQGEYSYGLWATVGMAYGGVVGLAFLGFGLLY